MTHAETNPTDAGLSRFNLVFDAINNLSAADLVRCGAWQSLADLSRNTEFGAVDGLYDSIIIHGERFEAAADVYVPLNYDEETSMSESFLANVAGHLNDGLVQFDRISVDVSGFYE